MIAAKASSMASASESRCGYAAIIGAPNAGKSTLLNQLVGSKVSIVSPKVQTTRNRILGIVVDGKSQIIFVDTPGIFSAQKNFEHAMVDAAWQGAQDADQVVLLLDASSGKIGSNERAILDGLKVRGRQAILALNKVDLMQKEKLLKLARTLAEESLFSRIFMISALTGSGVADLKSYLSEEMPKGPWLFPEDQISDLPLRLLAAEITRERCFHQLHQELPYALTVEPESWEEFANGEIRISQIIYVQREGQKAILLGKSGSRIKAVRVAAQKELSHILSRPVHLFLHVKVRESWQDDPERWHAIGLSWRAQKGANRR